MTDVATRLYTASAADRELADLVEAFAKRMEAGEALDVESFAREHPDHADELRQLLPGVQVLADLGRNADGSPQANVPKPVEGILGDFKIIREIGLREDDDWRRAALPRQRQVPLEPTPVEIFRQRGGNERDVDIRGHNLRSRRPTRGPPNERAAPRHDGADRGDIFGAAYGRGNPITDRWQVFARSSGMPDAPCENRGSVSDAIRHNVPLPMFGDDSRRHDVLLPFHGSRVCDCPFRIPA